VLCLNGAVVVRVSSLTKGWSRQTLPKAIVVVTAIMVTSTKSVTLTSHSRDGARSMDEPRTVG
jgi:hypothetical protein